MSKKGKAYIQGVLDTLTVLHFVLPVERVGWLGHYGSDILSASECRVKHKKGAAKFNEKTEEYEFVKGSKIWKGVYKKH